MLGQVYRENQKLVEEVEDDRKSAKFSPEPPPIKTLPKVIELDLFTHSAYT